jgi:Na+/melibiose symporter-like transporter
MNLTTGCQIPYYFGSYKAQSLQEICTLLFIVFGSGIVSAVLFIFLMRWFEKKTLYVFGSLVWFAFYIVVLFDTRVRQLFNSIFVH